MTLPEPDYIVLRPGPGLPTGFLPPGMDGRWYNLSEVPLRRRPLTHAKPTGGAEAVAVPTGRIEVRESDGAVAEVWEYRV